MASTPPTNEAFLREVDEELRRDQFAGYWQRWGRWTIGAIVAALALFAAFLWWQSHRSAQAGVEGERLSGAIDDLAAGKTASAQPVFTEISASKRDGYRASSKLTLAAMMLDKGDARGAAQQYGAIAADTSLPDSYRNLALVRQTAAEFDTLAPQAVIDRLKPLAAAGNPWFGSAGEMTGLAYLKLGKHDLAGATFAAIARDEGVPETIRSRVVQLAGAMGVDAIPAKGGK